jgi:hypothetical protein
MNVADFSQLLCFLLIAASSAHASDMQPVRPGIDRPGNNCNSSALARVEAAPGPRHGLLRPLPTRPPGGPGGRALARVRRR